MIGAFTLTHRRASLDVILHRVCCFFDPFLNCWLEFAGQFSPAVEVGHWTPPNKQKGVDSTFVVKPTPVVFSQRYNSVMPLVGCDLLRTVRLFREMPCRSPRLVSPGGSCPIHHSRQSIIG